MKTLKESLFDTDLTSKNPILYHPKTKAELKDCIEEELDKQGSNANLNCIDTSKITDMSYLFYLFSDDIENIDISLWNVSDVKNMNNMFDGCKKFDCDLSKWDVSKVENIGYMFYGCESFNCDLSKWDVSKVRNIEWAFAYCKKFNCDLSKWNVKNVGRMRNAFTFAGCKSLKKIPSWYYENS